MATQVLAGWAGPAVVVAAAIIGALLVATVLLTVGYSLIQYVRRHRRAAVRDDVETAMLDRLYGTADPEWGAWVAGLSGVERQVAESLLDEYLRALEGETAAELRDLGDALGIVERVETRLLSSNMYVRLRALTWCTLLESVPEAVRSGTYRPRTPLEAAVLARLSYIVDTDNRERAVDLLLDDRTKTAPFSAFGLDTLYFVSKDDPDAFLERAATESSLWSPLVYAQALLVVRHLHSMVSTDAPLVWAVAGLSQPAIRTRVEAANALGNYGWHDDVRRTVDVEAACEDPSPAVRAAVYEMLGSWGDEDASRHLRTALRDETDDRALVAGGRALTDCSDDPTVGDAFPPRVRQAVAWVRDHERYDALAKQGAPAGGSRTRQSGTED